MLHSTRPPWGLRDGDEGGRGDEQDTGSTWGPEEEEGGGGRSPGEERPAGPSKQADKHHATPARLSQSLP